MVKQPEEDDPKTKEPDMSNRDNYSYPEYEYIQNNPDDFSLNDRRAAHTFLFG